MDVLKELKSRLQAALVDLCDDPEPLLQMVRPAQDPRFGDYQANCAMPLGKQLQKSPRDIAATIVERLEVSDFCEPPEIAGPGFINLRLKDDWLAERLTEAIHDERLSVTAVERPRTVVIDFSSPNVAKPMHVGHIRSTVIGDAISRTLRFLGHKVITDNHLGDWGTQFGMIIHGFKHFVDREAYEKHPVAELGRLYKLVNTLVDYFNSRDSLAALEADVAAKESAADQQAQISADTADKAAKKKEEKLLRKLRNSASEARAKLSEVQQKVQRAEADPTLAPLIAAHPDIAQAVLNETAKLHAGDEENRRLWHEFLPACRSEIQRIYDRLGVCFDYEYGESFYDDLLPDVVAELKQRGLATESEGAICVFLDGYETPMIVQKKDGAFLYATTDLATVRFRMQSWQPDAILYVVDHRQSEHFDKFFAAAKLCGYTDVDLRHISFGTVLGEDGKPYKTRSGDTVGLESLLDEAVERAYAVVSANDDAKPGGAELSEEDRRQIAQVTGHAAIKYADLSQNRTSDYVFSYDKMVALQGNTATYMQYSYARVQSIFRRGDIDIDALRSSGAKIVLQEPAERALALWLLRFEEILHQSVEDSRPNQLTGYLFDLAKQFSAFFENCPVLKAGDETSRNSRLLLCDLTGRTIRLGLSLLGINVVNKM